MCFELQKNAAALSFLRILSLLLFQPRFRIRKRVYSSLYEQYFVHWIDYLMVFLVRGVARNRAGWVFFNLPGRFNE